MTRNLYKNHFIGKLHLEIEWWRVRKVIGLQIVKIKALFLAAVFLAAMLVSSSLTVLNVHAHIGAADSVKNVTSTSSSQTQFLVIIAVLLAVIVGLIIALIIMNRSQIRNRFRRSDSR